MSVWYQFDHLNNITSQTNKQKKINLQTHLFKEPVYRTDCSIILITNSDSLYYSVGTESSTKRSVQCTSVSS